MNGMGSIGPPLKLFTAGGNTANAGLATPSIQHSSSLQRLNLPHLPRFSPCRWLFLLTITMAHQVNESHPMTESFSGPVPAAAPTKQSYRSFKYVGTPFG